MYFTPGYSNALLHINILPPHITSLSTTMPQNCVGTTIRAVSQICCYFWLLYLSDVFAATMHSIIIVLCRMAMQQLRVEALEYPL